MEGNWGSGHRDGVPPPASAVLTGGLPKVQGVAAKAWLAAREAELLPVPYYHVVFTLPAAIADIGYQNKAVNHAQTRG